jgi:hypothetical protein
MKTLKVTMDLKKPRSLQRKSLLKRRMSVMRTLLSTKMSLPAIVKRRPRNL